MSNPEKAATYGTQGEEKPKTNTQHNTMRKQTQTRHKPSHKQPVGKMNRTSPPYGTGNGHQNTEFGTQRKSQNRISQIRCSSERLKRTLNK
jgi:hypothetical protein